MINYIKRKLKMKIYALLQNLRRHNTPKTDILHIFIQTEKLCRRYVNNYASILQTIAFYDIIK